MGYLCRKQNNSLRLSHRSHDDIEKVNNDDGGAGTPIVSAVGLGIGSIIALKFCA